MNPETEEAKKAVDQYATDQGFDPEDPQVRSMLDEKLDEFDGWMDQKPDWVRGSGVKVVEK